MAENKIKILACTLAVATLLSAASRPAQAGLIDRGNGLIYDNVLDITWIQDVGLSATQGGVGIHYWAGAKAWADQLVYGGFDDWRLPTLTPINGIQFNRTFHCDGSADYGYGISAPGQASAGFTGNELAYMYHVNLGNQPRCTGPGPHLENKVWRPLTGPENASFVDALTSQTVSFLNLQDVLEHFWTDLAPINNFTWYLTSGGFNDWNNAIYQRGRAWAVRDGDVLVTAVPEPSTALLLLSGLLPAFLFGKKRKGRIWLVRTPRTRLGACASSTPRLISFTYQGRHLNNAAPKAVDWFRWRWSDK